jgi:NAD(P)-dependent dehydrogenase (short-subunit alcohol dehydrogenase family)
MTDLYAPTNPTTKYPQPPFDDTKQPGPGDFREMDPAPDHGEQSYVGHGRLEGRTALITGGDSGIGRAVAIAYAREGADLVLNYLPDEQQQAESTAELVRDAGRTCELVPGDLADEAFNVQLVETAVATLGRIDVLVMVGGQMPTVSSIDDFDTATWQRVVDTNLSSLFWLTKAARPHLGEGAAIITTSSIQGFNPSPDLAEYAVTKAGIANFTRAMAQQLAEQGVRVNGVAPGPFWTPLQPASVPPEKLEQFGAQVPYGRPGQPVELSGLYVHLASQESSYTSGETFVVSGGLSVH